MFNRVLDIVVFGGLVTILFMLGWWSGHSYGLADNVTRCPPTYVNASGGVCEVCPWSIIYYYENLTNYIDVEDCGGSCVPKVVNGFLVCGPSDRVRIDGFCGGSE